MFRPLRFWSQLTLGQIRVTNGVSRDSARMTQSMENSIYVASFS